MPDQNLPASKSLVLLFQRNVWAGSSVTETEPGETHLRSSRERCLVYWWSWNVLPGTGPVLGNMRVLGHPDLNHILNFHCSPCFSTHFFCDYSYSILEIAVIKYADPDHHHHINYYPTISGTYFLHCLTPAFWIKSPTCLTEVSCVGENILSMWYEWVNQTAIVMSLSFKDITTNTW